MSLKDTALGMAERARAVSYEIASRSTIDKNRALAAMASLVKDNAGFIIEENKKDLEFARGEGKPPAFIDRLTLNEKRIGGMADALLEICALPDPVGSGNFTTRRPNGLDIQKVRVPLGVVFFIYESRPNVTTDAAGLILKAGNAGILRGGKEAVHSNTALAGLVRRALESAGFPADAVQLVEGTEHALVDEFLQLDQYIDVVIPRGGESLIRSIVEKSKIPVIRHDKGVCHLFVDVSAGPEDAVRIAVNAKCQRPSVCNAIETILLHKDYPRKKEVLEALVKNGVEIFADGALMKVLPGMKKAEESNYYTEYGDLKISAREVADVKEAVAHINRYGSHHSDAIVASDYNTIRYFMDRVDSAAVFANASTRFNDGGEFGLGAEIGISNQKLHSRGPMGLEDLTTWKWVVYGSGQIRE